MRTDDLPLSKNVVDRRGIPEPKTLNEHIQANAQEPQPERGKPESDSALARSLGVDLIGKGE